VQKLCLRECIRSTNVSTICSPVEIEVMQVLCKHVWSNH